MNPHDPIHDDDEQFAHLMKATQGDALPPDKDFLQRLRAQSTEAFEAAHAPQPSQPAPQIERKPSMLVRYSRWLKAAAALLVVGVGVYFWLASRNNLALGRAIENLNRARTLHVCVSRGGQDQIFIWYMGASKSWRWDDVEGNSRVVAGGKMWSINETKNVAKRVQAPGDDDSTVMERLLRLLELRPADWVALDGLAPAERRRDGDRGILVYRTEIYRADISLDPVHFEATADADTKQLLSIQCWVEKDGQKDDFRELTVLAYNEPIDAEKFVVADTLTEDGRIGSVVDVQGIVSIKPVLGQRWTPLNQRLVLRPGDRLRTDARGANAAAVRLVKDTGVILGPFTLVELISPKKIRLIEGEIEIAAGSTPVELFGPGAQKTTVNGRQIYRVRNGQLARVDREPPWLLGFKGAATTEALGSLVALVDGRNVPLTVGYHNVSVDIRDQIARTVIEESFVNHTDKELEGVFYFPLPPDASISGFGMWIGDKLIEADVVEKQRAREIYETLLRDRRDPGLLEWSGGNIFKARVFPIPAHADKRIKITYTQVLPLKGNSYRYSYALQSELLRQHPLRQLNIDVKISSRLPLKGVSSPTHPTRNHVTEHAAQVEFTDQSYTPTKDFELIVEVDNRPGSVVMIPHRRGDDGYFMLQLTPPGPDGNWDRPLVANGEPLHLLILADTSASIDAGQRSSQAAFLAALLSSLSPRDTFNLAACDVTCDWVFANSMSAGDASVAKARDFLAGRSSLGWTDLDAAFAAALKKARPGTHVLYVGDGIVTTGDADGIEFTRRLKGLYADWTAEHRGTPTFHAVSLSSSFEPAVLKAIASLGGGSLRKTTGEQGPAVVARELLAEIVQPGLRDLKVEFKGIRVARLYPESLANVAPGTQQILLGRYLPTGENQHGEVIVSGTQGGKPVSFSTQASLKDAEHGNSFIPRLWARMHLDSLLEQGSSPAIRDEIISLSEDFQIITPYTSLLVLETDADRERFKVKRRFQMRDGERFFAEGRDKAVFELKAKQMKQAGDWRTALRRSVLSELAGLGRQARLFQERRPSWRLSDGNREITGGLGGQGAPGVDIFNRYDFGLIAQSQTGTLMFTEAPPEAWGSPPFFRITSEDKTKLGVVPLDGVELYDSELPRGGDEDKRDQASLEREWEINPAQSPLPIAVGGFGGSPDGEFCFEGGALLVRKGKGPRSQASQYGYYLYRLFPPLARPADWTKEPQSTWPAAARDLASSLLRREQLTKLKDGIEIVSQRDAFDTRWKELYSRTRSLALVSAGSWLTRGDTDDGQTIVSWCDAKEMGVFSQDYQLGQVRAARPADVKSPPLDLADYSLTALDQSFADYVPTLRPQEKDRVLLVLERPEYPLYQTHVLIDTARHVILSIENRYQDKVTQTVRFSDFVEAGGTWWAQKIETLNADGIRSALITQTITSHSLDELHKRLQTELAGRAQVQLLKRPLPGVLEAKKAVVAGQAKFDDHFVLMVHFLHSEQWERVFDHLDQAAKISGRPGMRWLRSAVLAFSPRHNELRLRSMDDARDIVKDAAAKPQAEYYRAGHIYKIASNAHALAANEMLALLDVLRPIYENQPAYLYAMKHWQQNRLSYLDSAGQPEKAMLIRKELAVGHPHDCTLQKYYAQALAESGDHAAAYAWLTKVDNKDAKWLGYEEDDLRSAYAQLLRQQGRYADLEKYLAEWVAKDPDGATAYDQYLAVLFKSDQIDRAQTLMAKWLKDAQVPGELKPAVVSRLTAAMNFMLGNNNQFRVVRMDERWLPQLAGVVTFFARSDMYGYLADDMMQRLQYQMGPRTDAARKLRQTFAGILTAEIDKLPPAQIGRFVNWLSAGDLSQAAADRVAAGLRQRWANEPRADLKQTLDHALVTLLQQRDSPAELLAFLRLAWQKAPERRRAEYAGRLFDRLLDQPWTLEIETEAVSMLDKLSGSDEPGERLYSAVAALYQLTDRMVSSRIAAQTNKLEHPEKLSRTELLKKQEEIRRLARERLADRLRQEAGKAPRTLAPWLLAESLYLDIPQDRHLKEAAGDIWQVLGDSPAAVKRPQDIEPEQALQYLLDGVLRERYLVMAMNLAARKGADPAFVVRLLRYVDRGIESPTDDGRWKQAKTNLLVALDRRPELEQTLQQWAQLAGVDSRWRIALGYLLAEQGKLSEAIAQLEVVEKADELSPAAYASLAGWYNVQGQRAEHERAALAVYKTTPEGQLARMLQAKLYPWQPRSLRNGGRLPTELDTEVLRIFTVLFARSGSPQSYLHRLQEFYQAARDFRLLAVLPDAVLGHTPERIYPFLQGMNAVLGEIRDEAAADELVKRIGDVRSKAKTDVDRRALDLLEAQVERRAAELQNQPGPHRDLAVKALERAFKHTWAAGEERLMADYLAGLGKITQPSLAQVQLEQLKKLHAEAPAGSLVKLHIAHQYARALFEQGRSADAMDQLQAALNEFKLPLPVEANGPLGSLIHYLESAGHFVRAEKVLLAQLASPLHAEQRRWLIEQLDQVYLRALENKGEVSLGKGLGLYRALNAKIGKDLGDDDEAHRSRLIALQCDVFAAAHKLKLQGVKEDVTVYAAKVLPPILKDMVGERDSVVDRMARTAYEVGGARLGIVVLLDEIEREPRWLRYSGATGWSKYGALLNKWRLKAADDLDAGTEARLLKLVLSELRIDLETRVAANRTIYSNWAGFWRQKTPDFVKVADAVLAQHNKSSDAVRYIASYLFWDLEEYKRGIEVLQAAYQDKVLDDDGQAELALYLQHESRYAESIPLLVPLIERRPDYLTYRVQLMHAYFRTGRKDDLLALLKQTDAYLHEKEQWNEDSIQRLAASTLENEFFERAVAYYREAIPLHEQANNYRTSGDGTLSSYYTGLARAHAGLKQTDQAVEAAGAAVVAWGHDSHNREKALDTLKDVLLAAANLDGFVAEYDQRMQDRDSAVIRKALGRAYAARKEHRKAIKQFELAATLQPNDADVCKHLLDSYDALGDKEGAVRQLLQSVQVSPRELKLYQELGDRYKTLAQAAEAERAYTSIVEMLPAEAESHAMLAEVREKQNRWPEAIDQWRLVAKLRALEPNGLLKLAAAQIHEKQIEQAQETIDQLNRTTWPAAGADLRKQIRALEESLAKLRGR